METPGQFQFTLIPVYKRYNEKREVKVIHYQASWKQIGHFQPDQSIEKELQKGLETGITQVLEPDMNDTDRLYINIESNTYSQAFSHLFVYAGEWGKSEIMEQVFDDLKSGLVNRNPEVPGSNPGRPSSFLFLPKRV